MLTDQVDQKREHWKEIEERNYFYFMVLEADLLKKNKKQTRFYQKMSRFIHGRSNLQCRTHHIKMIQKFKLKQKEELFIYKLYHQYCRIRLINQEHLKKEIRIFISESFQIGLINHQQMSSYLIKVDQSIGILKLEETCMRYQEKKKKEHLVNSEQNSDMRINECSLSLINEDYAAICDRTHQFEKSKVMEREQIDLYLNQYESII